MEDPRNCPTCGRPLHLVTNPTWQGWMHASAFADYNCYLLARGE